MRIIFSVFIVLACSFANAGEAGNGGDGLELKSPPVNGVQVPIPNGLGDQGHLLVQGQPGAGQTSNVEAIFLGTDAKGKLILFGQGAPIKGQLNARMDLLPGKYLVVYSGTSAWVDIPKNETKVLSLGTITVPQTSRPVTFEVFVDMTSSSMQTSYLNQTFTSAELKKFYLSDHGCGVMRWANEPICKAIEESYKKISSEPLRGMLLVFNKDGSMNVWYNAGIQWGYSVQWAKVVDPKAGETISVFSGVYGIRFTDTQSGDVRSTLGIQVK